MPVFLILRPFELLINRLLIGIGDFITQYIMILGYFLEFSLIYMLLLFFPESDRRMVYL